MQSQERIPYQSLKDWALDAYFDGCRDLALMRKFPHEQIIGFVSYAFEDGFERPIEDLMWRVILLILSGGWHPELEERNRKTITKDIAEQGLDRLLSGVPKEEAELFKHDLTILKLSA
jgi:hypothetical protein